MAKGATDPVVTVTISAGVATLTLVDEANRNALTRAVVAELIDGLAAANASASVRVIVITNTGRIFCAGADLSEQSGAGATADSPPPPGRGPDGLVTLLRLIQQSPTPVVARVDGHAVAGGVGLVAACDISIARDDVLLGFTEVRVGVIPAMISVVCLPKMRRGDALEAFLRGRRFLAPEAAGLGLITRAVPAAELDAEVAAVVDDLTRGGPVALAEAKRLVYDVPMLSAEDAWRLTTERSQERFTSAEAAEGMAAFLEKRAPAWAPRDQ
ncbi:MAG: enoyl-CoA hydratase [Acidimicrobiia bacterium]|nr:enoyl-CoA hydratase [Acidimicrobiia bacterium]